MDVRWRLIRLLAGLAVLLFTAFSLIVPRLRTWGSSPAEVAMRLPGDELLARPELVMTHGITIEAPLREVWPWIAQLGDVRGGFYSYTFIENLVAGQRLYRNAGRIVPELQNPAAGEQLIEGMMSIHSLEQSRWLLGKAPPELGMGWTWVWALFPQGEERTRLIVRYRIGRRRSWAATRWPVSSMPIRLLPKMLLWFICPTLPGVPTSPCTTPYRSVPPPVRQASAHC